jgi:hypothetical protein
MKGGFWRAGYVVASNTCGDEEEAAVGRVLSLFPLVPGKATRAGFGEQRTVREHVYKLGRMRC